MTGRSVGGGNWSPPLEPLTITLILSTENEAFADPNEVARIFAAAAKKVEQGPGTYKLLDINGNSVGKLVVEPEGNES